MPRKLHYVNQPKRGHAYYIGKKTIFFSGLSNNIYIDQPVDHWRTEVLRGRGAMADFPGPLVQHFRHFTSLKGRGATCEF